MNDMHVRNVLKQCDVHDALCVQPMRGIGHLTGGGGGRHGRDQDDDVESA
jgi:hypothetical protein